MSDQNGDGGKDRATVALVAAKLDGLRDLTEAGFVNVQRQLDPLSDVPAKLADHEARIKAREHADEYRRGPGFAHVLAALALLVSVAAVAASLLP